MLKLLGVGALLALVAGPVHAAINYEQVDGDLYFVTYQMNRFFQGGLLTDTKKKNTKKLYAKVHKVCEAEGYKYLHVITPKEIVEDETLKAYWDMYAGGEAASQEVMTRESSTGRANIIKRLVRFSEEEQEGFERCQWKK